jgi:cysteine synthase
MLPRIFELFVQGDRTIDRQSGGLGVGLALVRRLTELHGVLVVEDNADGREMLRTMLEYYGHEVHEAADGAAAVEIAARMRARTSRWSTSGCRASMATRWPDGFALPRAVATCGSSP